ncbi:thioesterase II family protein [Scytonema sp. PRP1]|uniref:thioesterase II family protein n=1 Tax=Scytonema sp. PRP1 TaxID=3120513 RepID=UPI002FD48F44
MSTNLSSCSWVTCPEPNSRAKLRLFCLPYAGANARVFGSWAMNLPTTVEVCPIELPGHGSRWMETAFTQLQSLVEAIAAAVIPYLDKPFACFGHTMGALLSFELVVLLRKQYGMNPRHLFISGRRAPEIPSPVASIHALNDNAFIDGLRHYNGMPEAVLQNTKFMELLLPTLRADFALVETYEYVPQPPLNCPITTFGGLEDSTVNNGSLKAWRKHTHAAFTTEMLPGNHFFIHSSQQLLLQLLSRILHTIC